MPSRRRDANAKQVNVRMPPDELKSLDVWIKTQPAPRPTRAEDFARLPETTISVTPCRHWPKILTRPRRDSMLRYTAIAVRCRT